MMRASRVFLSVAEFEYEIYGLMRLHKTAPKGLTEAAQIIINTWSVFHLLSSVLPY